MLCFLRPLNSHGIRPLYPIILLVFALLSSAACTKTSPSTSDQTTADIGDKTLQRNTSGKTLDNPKRFRGLFTYGHEVRSFSFCGQSDELWVIDQTQGDAARTSRAMTSQPYQPIFVEVEGSLTTPPLDGFGAEYSGAVVFEKLIHASLVGESWGCREQYDKFIFKAQGNEPGWTVVISKNGIMFSSINHENPIDFPLVAPVATENAATYETATDKHALQLSLMDEKCFDTMSGERFGWKAEAKLDGKPYVGCAKQGDQLP